MLRWEQIHVLYIDIIITLTMPIETIILIILYVQFNVYACTLVQSKYIVIKL